MTTELFAGLFDDAAMFPPGNSPLEAAIPAHSAHRSESYRDTLGPFIFPAPRLTELANMLHPDGELSMSLTVPGGPTTLDAAFAQLSSIRWVRLRALEIVVDESHSPASLVTALDDIAATRPDVEIFVEIPRDERRESFLRALSGTSFAAKFRTGGVHADAYPDEAELAAAVRTVVGHDIPFKATAGLHHAIRNTDPTTGFEQHGFVNLMLAVHLAGQAAGIDELIAVLGDRNGNRIAERIATLTTDEIVNLRSRFRSFGTCSVIEPLDDLAALGLLPTSYVRQGATL
ncbi:hypothetical protein A5788_18435 [Gordonia sp. 852002-50816_SCH5313054-c]|nr:hypothetical protein A5785_19945 [Gordonia sp. 852002-50395_SCH5434458]OBC13979.1 hypothetical protein A5788_18435 [Gordonia sp. 852002-50816_SCH5313054-c]OBC16271.1 hypothetical protein A5786_20620 [Gordonia sp. 852002-50816_SCH5313054-a]